MLNTQQFAAAQQAHFDTLVDLTAKAFEGVEQLTALNLQTAKSGLEKAAETTYAALSVKDPQALLTLQAGLLQPSADKAMAYGRQVIDIISTAKSEFEKVASEQAAEAQTTFLSAIEAASKNAPEGATSGVALFKQAISAANNAFDGFQKATRQATDAAEANYTAMTASATKPAAKAKRG
jgi:phasin family protein